MKGEKKVKDKNSILRYFSPDIRILLDKNTADIHEIRLRCEKPLVAVSYSRKKYVLKNGGLSDYSAGAYIVSSKDIEYTFSSVCDYSIHSYENEIAQGFITVNGGHRAGIAGSAVISGGRVSAVKYISSINFRVASQVNGCADRIYRELFADKPCSVLIAGAPSSGKTTVLRDLCRQLGEKYSVSVIDERGEIGAVYHGRTQNDTGFMCDIFDGYPKAYGLRTALRVMSPEIAVCDEIGGDDDIGQLVSCANSGVRIAASAHAGSIDELYSRPDIRTLLENRVFDYIVMLGDRSLPGTVRKIERISYDGLEALRNNYDSVRFFDDRSSNVRKTLRTCKDSGNADKSD